MNIALRILEIVLPVLAIIAFGYFIGRSWKPDMRERVRARFEALRPPAGQPFTRPMRVNLLQKP